ncbi:hypothetical protein ABW19_dt0203402 [Dactylella cylindrospora]|nr:hypothetical protein ABW19_dt0203402 [Dactylella cylindrospora]
MRLYSFQISTFFSLIAVVSAANRFINPPDDGTDTLVYVANTNLQLRWEMDYPSAHLWVVQGEGGLRQQVPPYYDKPDTSFTWVTAPVFIDPPYQWMHFEIWDATDPTDGRRFSSRRFQLVNGANPDQIAYPQGNGTFPDLPGSTSASQPAATPSPTEGSEPPIASPTDSEEVSSDSPVATPPPSDSEETTTTATTKTGSTKVESTTLSSIQTRLTTVIVSSNTDATSTTVSFLTLTTLSVSVVNSRFSTAGSLSTTSPTPTMGSSASEESAQVQPAPTGSNNDLKLGLGVGLGLGIPLLIAVAAAFFLYGRQSNIVVAMDKENGATENEKGVGSAGNGAAPSYETAVHDS